MRDSTKRKVNIRKKIVEWHEVPNKIIFEKELVEQRRKLYWMGML